MTYTYKHDAECSELLRDQLYIDTLSNTGTLKASCMKTTKVTKLGLDDCSQPIQETFNYEKIDKN
jgi:hypothetical protein